ncbi:glycosyltransferase family 2 protein [Zwartia sp.]|uniref:glycosyltransferase family 2 protein n=1 Tax=Zwartia sp. TaxID=2978004 RepID=UPI0027198E23|nr:glycosyltransferase family 2 protein [Zwartia sp.]MDO9025916.1 glycosyltransferase family 2 protein [Zwartia sp.]
MTKQLVSVICPFFNEEQTATLFYKAVIAEINNQDRYDFEIICVDDGSEDDTLKLLLSFAKDDSRFRIVQLTRNFGKEAALSAGIDASTGAWVILIDADLQDPVSLINQMLEAREVTGAEVVLARRKDRKGDHFLKRLSANMFYNLYNKLSHIKIPVNVGDCRLMSRQVVDAIKLFPEKQRFMKGLLSWVGFYTITIDYVRENRSAGTSKFSGWKLWNLALEGITSFSTLPLRVWTYFGALGALLSFGYGFYILFKTLVLGVDVPGYASMLVSLLFVSSIQLIGLGVMGEYVGRIYMESKRRPTYLINKIYGKKNVQSHFEESRILRDDLDSLGSAPMARELEARIEAVTGMISSGYKK